MQSTTHGSVAFLIEEVDSIRIDEEGDYPEEVVEGLRRLGAFGMKIPREYGGLGFSQVEYARVMQLLGSRDGNLSALLSAHQSIGVPQPLKLFGSEALKKKYLPRCAAGEISAFALTESHVGLRPGQAFDQGGADSAGRRLHSERHQAVVYERDSGNTACRDGR